MSARNLRTYGILNMAYESEDLCHHQPAAAGG